MIAQSWRGVVWIIAVAGAEPGIPLRTIRGATGGEGLAAQVPPPQATRVSDSLAIGSYAERHRLAVLRIVAQSEPYYAAIASDSAGGRYLIAVEIRNHRIVPLQEPRLLGQDEPTSVQWISLGRPTVDALSMTFDERFEGIVGTVIFSLSSHGTLRQIYADGEGVCRAAEVTDLDRDGRAELLSYVEDPSTGDCGDECHISISDHVGVSAPAWVRIQQWNGEAWIDVSQNFSAFYGRLADVYEELDRWLRQDPSAERCRGTYWVKRDPNVFRRWAVRARSLASK